MQQVGEIIQVVMREDKLYFIVSLYDAIRTDCGFFQACPKDIIDIIGYRKLIDYKPLLKRDGGTCFRFLLHHHIATPT